MIRLLRTLLLLGFWALFIPFAALIGFPATFITGKIDFLYRLAMWGAHAGIRLSGVKIEIIGLDRLDPARKYIFMSNHVSNLDPPIEVPLIPGRTSVLVKKELFRVPLLGQAMHMGNLVPVDRTNRESAIDSLRKAADVLRDWPVHMTIYPEGTRSRDGRLLPFKKGPFYLAVETGMEVVPITILGTFEIWPKGEWLLRPGTATVIFHPPIDPAQLADRDDLMATVWNQINSALPPERRASGA